MKKTGAKFSKAHLYIFLFFYAGFAVLTLAVLLNQSSSDWQSNWNLTAIIGSASGPMTGAIARGFQECCLEFSLKILPFSLAFLAAGTAIQFAPIPWRFVKLFFWGFGLLGWFAGGILSFAHALS